MLIVYGHLLVAPRQTVLRLGDAGPFAKHGAKQRTQLHRLRCGLAEGLGLPDRRESGAEDTKGPLACQAPEAGAGLF